MRWRRLTSLNEQATLIHLFARWRAHFGRNFVSKCCNYVILNHTEKIIDR